MEPSRWRNLSDALGDFEKEKRKEELQKLNLADVPYIRKQLREAYSKLTKNEEQLEGIIQNLARCIKKGIMGHRWRRIAVYALWLDYKQYEMAWILNVSERTIRRDIRCLERLMNPETFHEEYKKWRGKE